MADVSRRKGISIELAVLNVWVVVPAVVLALSHVPSSAGIMRHPAGAIYEDVRRLGEIGLVLFIIWNSGDRWEAFGIRKIAWLRDFGVGAVITVLTCASFLIGPARTFATLSDYVQFPPQETLVALLRITYSGLSVLFDELLFRGCMLSRIEELTGNRWWGVVISAVLFSSLSFGRGFASVLLFLAFGLMCGISYVLTGSLWPGAIGRFAFILLQGFVYHGF